MARHPRHRDIILALAIFGVMCAVAAGAQFTLRHIAGWRAVLVFGALLVVGLMAAFRKEGIL